MKDEHAKFDELLGVLDEVMTKGGTMHGGPMNFGTGVPLYRSEIHTIQAIGSNPGINVTRLAERIDVTKGAVSQTVTKLTGKRLVRKIRAEDNAKETRLVLTDLGWVGYESHERFHGEMYDTVRDYFGDEFNQKLDTFLTVMRDLNNILARYEKRQNRS